VIGNVDFGHTTPTATFPIGGTAEVDAIHDAPRVRIVSH
jgi:muramoyltetrapeptide carboxypeptidase LdcA involved in peptidoglycan recycling